MIESWKEYMNQEMIDSANTINEEYLKMNFYFAIINIYHVKK